MEVKFLEIRDKATFIPTLAIQICGADSYLASRAGYSRREDYIILHPLESNTASYDPYFWGGGRTLVIAHSYIKENWDKLKSDDVVDVEFILGETSEPKKSESLE